MTDCQIKTELGLPSDAEVHRVRMTGCSECTSWVTDEDMSALLHRLHLDAQTMDGDVFVWHCQRCHPIGELLYLMAPAAGERHYGRYYRSR
jgi:hypothetical protein